MQHKRSRLQAHVGEVFSFFSFHNVADETGELRLRMSYSVTPRGTTYSHITGVYTPCRVQINPRY